MVRRPSSSTHGWPTALNYFLESEDFKEWLGSAPVVADGLGVKFQAAVALGLKTSSNSMGVR